MKKNLTRIKTWYYHNTEKLLIFFMLLVILTLIFVYIPYINIFITSGIGVLLTIILWYLLFSPVTKVFIISAIFFLFFAMIYILLEVYEFADITGDIVYLLLLFILITEAKSYFVKKRKVPSKVQNELLKTNEA